MPDISFLQDLGKTHLPVVFNSYQLVYPRLPLLLVEPGMPNPWPYPPRPFGCGALNMVLKSCCRHRKNQSPLLYWPHSLPQLNHSPDLWTQPNPTPVLGQGWSRFLTLHTPAWAPWSALQPPWPYLFPPESPLLAQVPPAPLASVGKPVRFYLNFSLRLQASGCSLWSWCFFPDIYFPFL